MMNIELTVNGRLITEVAVVNAGRVSFVENDDTCKYHVFVMPDTNLYTRVMHRPSEGAEVLASKVLAAVSEAKKVLDKESKV